MDKVHKPITTQHYRLSSKYFRIFLNFILSPSYKLDLLCSNFEKKNYFKYAAADLISPPPLFFTFNFLIT
jgi:hypothetical protein